MEHFAATIALIGLVIVIASLLSGVLERSGLPVVAAFLGLGALLGPRGFGLVDFGFDSPALHALAMLGLALVLFSDAVTIETTEVRARRRLLWRILGPGTLGPALLMVLAARWLLDLPWTSAAILGAALASTDPVLLRTVLRSRALPPTPRVALRIETGTNDAVLLPVVAIAILVANASGPDGANGSGIARSVIGLFLLGPALGAIVGWAGIRVLARVRSSFGVRRDYESLYAIGLAFTGFALAEAVGGSGFLAAFTAGLVVGSQDVELCDCFLEYGEASAEMLLLLTFVALGASLIWTGLAVADAPTLIFAAFALVVRTAVLFPVLSTAGVHGRDRRLIALFGPRGLSSLLLVLLPVFAGVPGAERLFSVASLVVLLSVLVHGSGIALFLRKHAAPAIVTESATAADGAGVVPERVTIEELRTLQERGEPVIIVDSRTERHAAAGLQAEGAVRVAPDDPVRDATEQRLSQRATLVVYCA